MKTCARLTLIALLSILLISCAHITPEQLSRADFGTYPAKYQDDIKSFMSQRLKDPYSAVYSFSEPRKGYAYINGTLQDPVFGYLIYVGVNAKNSFGGYVGEKPYTFIFSNKRFWKLESYAVKGEI